MDSNCVIGHENIIGHENQVFVHKKEFVRKINHNGKGLLITGGQNYIGNKISYLK